MGIYTDNSQVMNTVQTIPTKLNDIVSSIIGKASELLNAPTAEQIQRIDWSSITAILGTISIILILTIVFLISLYILKSVGLYVMAKKEGKNFAWLAFVPFGCLFTYGFITGKTKVFGIEVDHPEYLLPALLVSSCLPYVGCIGTVLFILAYFAMLYRIYQTRTPNFATVLLILSILVPILSPIILFAIRNK
ncbi:MAG: hypothetical protein IJ272_00095 [Clostridia bacterium]|nr:hypothetical protein [Clostridia bacterium]